MPTEEVFFCYWKWLGEQGACLLTGSTVLLLLEKIILRWGKFSPFFCLEFLCFLGKAIRKLVHKATLVASRILRFPWLNPSGFSPKYSRQAALLALINYIFQMIDQGTVMYTNRFWSHLTLDSVAFWVVVTVWFVPIVVDYLFISTFKKMNWKRLLAWLWHLMLPAPYESAAWWETWDLQTCLQWQVDSGTVGSTTLFGFTTCGREKSENLKQNSTSFWHIFSIYFVCSAILKWKQTMF